MRVLEAVLGNVAWRRWLRGEQPGAALALLACRDPHKYRLGKPKGCADTGDDAGASTPAQINPIAPHNQCVGGTEGDKKNCWLAVPHTKCVRVYVCRGGR